MTPSDGLARVIACNATEDIIEGTGCPRNPSVPGSAGFGGPSGYSPCEIDWSDLRLESMGKTIGSSRATILK
jgi:hypothetical protein